MRVGVLLNSELTIRKNLEFITSLETKGVEVILLFKENHDKRRRNIRSLHFGLLSKLQQYFVDKDGILSKVRLPRTYRSHYLKCIYSSSGLRVAIEDSSINLLKSLGLDKLVRLDFTGIFTGEILLHDVISIHHGDNDWNRGGPAGFWEVMRGEPSCGYIIQVLTEDLDAGEVLFKGYTKNHFLHVKNKINLFIDSYNVLEDIVLSKEIKMIHDRKALFYSGIILKMPSLKTQYRYIFLLLYHLLKRFLFEEKWDVYYLDTSRSRELRKAKIAVKVPKGQFYADPFLFRFKNDIFALVEAFDMTHSKKAVINCLVLDDGKWRLHKKDVIPLATHLSYPMVFEVHDRLFCVPESSKIRKVIIFELDKNSFKWNQLVVVENDLNVVDCNFVQEDGVLKLHGTFAYGNKDYSWKRVYYTANRIEGPWSRKLMFDATSIYARNAGMFTGESEAHLIQTHGMADYGKSIHVRSSNGDLTNVIEPDFNKNISGIHHMSLLESHLLFDVKTMKVKFL